MNTANDNASKVVAGSSPNPPSNTPQSMPSMASALQTPISSNNSPSNPALTSSNLNNSLSSTPNPFRSGPIGGDIVLNPDQPKKRSIDKKPFIIGGIVVGVFLIILLIIVLIVSSLGSVSNEDSETAFTHYATYLLYGEVRDQLEGEYDPEEGYELEVQFYDEDFNAEYWDTAKGLLDATLESYQVDEDDYENIEFYEALTNYQSRFNEIYEYKKTIPPTPEKLEAIYLESGAETAKEYARKYYNDLSDNTESEFLKEYASLALKDAEDNISLQDVYNRNICLTDDLSESCYNNLSPEEKDIILTISQYKLETGGYTGAKMLSEAVTGLEEDCWGINERFQNPLFNELVIVEDELDDINDEDYDESDDDYDEEDYDYDYDYDEEGDDYDEEGYNYGDDEGEDEDEWDEENEDEDNEF